MGFAGVMYTKLWAVFRYQKTTKDTDLIMSLGEVCSPKLILPTTGITYVPRFSKLEFWDILELPELPEQVG